MAGILSRRSFHGTTAFYFALVSNWRVKGGAKTADIGCFRCNGEWCNNGDERMIVLWRRENGFVEGDERFSGSIVVRSLWFG